ncbi:hypothetical protein C7N43_04310 [Sphingobacteriales bacterium UPWRP_1]|nr:hypothetical protein C7N43_04310 [Sphingobacteriales bacterium UPWRP_1]
MSNLVLIGRRLNFLLKNGYFCTHHPEKKDKQAANRLLYGYLPVLYVSLPYFWPLPFLPVQ